MRVKLSKDAGFCFGVKRAINTALKANSISGSVYTYGPIIHNPQVVKDFDLKGIKAVENLKNVKEGSTIIIRTHGVPPEVERQFKLKKLRIIDATCPFVKKPQEYVRQLSRDGYTPIIIGEADHPEVIGIKGYAGKIAIVVGTPAEAEKVHPVKKMGIVVQTTQSNGNFSAIMKVLSGKSREFRILNTICNATHERQDSALKLAGEVDIMIVVGGKNSANTKHLAEVCETTGVETRHIEAASELQTAWFRGKKTAGVTAGASTPDWIIKEVAERIKKL